MEEVVLKLVFNEWVDLGLWRGVGEIFKQSWDRRTGCQMEFQFGVSESYFLGFI